EQRTRSRSGGAMGDAGGTRIEAGARSASSVGTGVRHGYRSARVCSRARRRIRSRRVAGARGLRRLRVPRKTPSRRPSVSCGPSTCRTLASTACRRSRRSRSARPWLRRAKTWTWIPRRRIWPRSRCRTGRRWRPSRKRWIRSWISSRAIRRRCRRSTRPSSRRRPRTPSPSSAQSSGGAPSTLARRWACWGSWRSCWASWGRRRTSVRSRSLSASLSCCLASSARQSRT
ncbi:unnamed protein product, partial [Prorocentrum cordatum]